MYNKQHLSNILGYVGVWFISWSISHGFFSHTRSIIMAVLGIWLFIIWEILKPGEKRYWSLLIFWLIYSISVGMVSWGLQHFLDGPTRSLIIVPVWFFISLLIFPRKEHTIQVARRKHLLSLLIGCLISWILYGGLYLAYHKLPESAFTDLDDHNAHEKVEANTPGWMKWLSDKDIQAHCAQMPSMEGCSQTSPTQTWSNPSISWTSGQKSAASSHNHADMVTSEFDFIALMIPHHQEAVDTSSRLLQITQSPFYKYLCSNIVNNQNKEIAMMKDRLAQRYPNQTYSGMPYMPMMRDTSTISAITTIERMWTEDMIKHHQGAVDMASKVLTLNPRQEVRDFSLAIIKDQSQEIELMKEQLEQQTTDNSLESMQKSLDGMNEPAVIQHH